MVIFSVKVQVRSRFVFTHRIACCHAAAIAREQDFLLLLGGVSRTPSFGVEFRNNLVTTECVARRSLLNSAERNCERAKDDWQRQCPETEPDFQGGPGGTAADEPNYVGERHACSASGFGEFVGVSAAAGERYQIDSQLSNVHRHYGSGWRVFQG